MSTSGAPHRSVERWVARLARKLGLRRVRVPLPCRHVFAPPHAVEAEVRERAVALWKERQRQARQGELPLDLPPREDPG